MLDSETSARQVMHSPVTFGLFFSPYSGALSIWLLYHIAHTCEVLCWVYCFQSNLSLKWRHFVPLSKQSLDSKSVSWLRFSSLVTIWSVESPGSFTVLATLKFMCYSFPLPMFSSRFPSFQPSCQAAFAMTFVCCDSKENTTTSTKNKKQPKLKV